MALEKLIDEMSIDIGPLSRVIDDNIVEQGGMDNQYGDS